MIFPKRRNEGGELRMAAMKSDLAAGWMVNRVAPSWEMCLCAAASHFLPEPPAFLPLSRSLSLRTCIVCIYARAADRSRAPLSNPPFSPAAICSPVYVYIRLSVCVCVHIYICVYQCIYGCVYVCTCLRVCPTVRACTGWWRLPPRAELHFRASHEKNRDSLADG